MVGDGKEKLPSTFIHGTYVPLVVFLGELLIIPENMLFCGESYTADENCLNVLVDFVSSSLFNVLSMKISE